MTILRPTNEDFGSRWFVGDMGLSLAGKGLLIVMMLFSEKIFINEYLFYRLCGDKKEIVDEIFEELKMLRYVIYDEKNDTYIVYEKPLSID